MSYDEVLASKETQLACLSVTDLSQVLSKLHSARALAIVACTSKLFSAASHLAFRDLCASSGRSLQKHRTHGDPSAMIGCNQHNCQLSTELHSGRKQPVVDWRSMFFQQSYALSFNGINEYVSLPGGWLSQPFAGVPDNDGSTIDMMILAHAIPACPPSRADTKPCKAVVPPAGGMLLSCQDREFGRSRRAARLETIALLYIGTDGYLYSGIGPIKSWQCIADDHWHRVTLVLRWISPYRWNALLYIDGHVGATGRTVHCASLPHYPVLGSGVTEGCPYGSCTPVYNCHSFHGLIDELRIWARPLAMFEVGYAVPHLQVHCAPRATANADSVSLTDCAADLFWRHSQSLSTAVTSMTFLGNKARY
ncbi:hypothetical protein ABBQ32_002554 [Trebouxia sp. C0010 RCD-2024]